MSRSHATPDVADRDRVVLADVVRLVLVDVAPDYVEPHDFDDRRMTERHGPAAGFFACETNRYDDDWEVRR